MHGWVPVRRQAPTPAAQGCPFRGNASSLLPSQLLSLPSQISGWGGGAVQPTQLPKAQLSLPAPQALSHDRVRFSATAPSQSSSRPLQVSVAPPPATAEHCTPRWSGRQT